MIAQIARYHRKSAPKASHADFQALAPADQEMVRALAGLLRIGIALDRTRQAAIDDLTVSRDDAGVRIEVAARPDVDLSLEIYTANQRSRLLAGVLGSDVHVELVPAGGGASGRVEAEVGA